MNKQLSLFPKTITEDRLIKQAEGLTVTVDANCQNCGVINTIGPHIPIHSLAWMKKNWKETSPNKFIVSAGFCSRECENQYLEKFKGRKK